MKKRVIILMAVVLGTLSSCNKDEAIQATTDNAVQPVTFTIATEATETRAVDAGVTRYIMEVYSDAAATTPVNCFEDGTTNRAVLSTGTFTTSLNLKDTYTILFWADNGNIATPANSDYNTDDLKVIALNSSKAMNEHAYYKHITGIVAETQNVTLKRAVSKLNFVQSAEYSKTAATNVIVTYSTTNTFNVLDGTIASVNTERIFTGASMTIEVDALLGTDYTFAAVSGGLFNMTVKLAADTKAAKSVSNVPSNANAVTNIKGQYSTDSPVTPTFIITETPDWVTPETDSSM